MKIAPLICSICLLSHAWGEDWHYRWDRSGTTWYEKWTNTLNALDKLPRNEQIEILGRGAALGDDPGQNSSSEKRMIFERAQAALLAIPGHAEYFRDRILKAREDYEHPDPMVGPLLGKLDDAQTYGFQTLSQLPSVETVRVLGEFLADERGKLGGPGPPPRMDGKRSMESPNCNQALSALHTLPLVKKPVAGKDVDSDKDLETYRLWYAQIKSGNRTFRFEGDPTEYDLDGPAPPEKLRRIAEHRVRDAARAERSRPDDRAASTAAAMAESSGTTGQTTGTLAGIFALAAALAAAGWYFLRGRRGRAG